MSPNIPTGNETTKQPPSNRPVFKNIGDGHRYTWGHLPGTVIELGRFRESRGDLTAEVTIYYPKPGLPNGLLSRTKLNLLSSTRSRLAKDLKTRVAAVDWDTLLEQVCFISLEYYRNGDPTIDLREVPVDGRPRWILWPYIEHGGPTILAAPGGAGKSLLAMAIAYSIAGGYALLGRMDTAPMPALYLDYETDAGTHAERLRALAAGLGNKELPPVFYRRMTASLTEAVSYVRKEIARLDIGFVVVDSVGYAGDGNPNDAATALGLFRSIRELDIPCLAVHHVRKPPAGIKASNNIDAIYGSVYFINSARRVWQVDSTEPEEEQGVKYISLKNTKANNGRLERTHAFRMALENDNNDRLTTVQLDSCRMDDIPEFVDNMSVKDRILIELREGALDRNQLAEQLDTTPGNVSKELSQLKKRGKIVSVGSSRWGLLEASTLS